MTTEANDEGQDVFDDSGADDASTADPTTGGQSQDTTEGGLDDGSEGEDQQTDKTGAKDSGTPPEDQEDLEAVVDAKGQKLIPEHRFKAALKKVTDELATKDEELKKYTTPEIKVPDKETDPEGHALHVRMEASVQVMREMKSDYQEVINHYATLAESNPLLNQAVEAHAIPAKLAYDIGKRDLEIKKVDAILQSGEWDQFQAWKAEQAKLATTKTEEQTKQTNSVASRLKAVPNLNRSTNASPNRNVRKVSNGENDDDLFAGAL